MTASPVFVQYNLNRQKRKHWRINLLNLLITSWGLISDKSKQKLIVLTIMQFIAGLIDLVGVLLISLVISIGVGTATNSDIFSFANQIFESISRVLGISVIQTMLTISILLFIFKTVLSYLLTKKILNTLAIETSELTIAITRKVLGAPHGFITEFKSQNLLYSLTGGIESIVLGFLGGVLLLTSETFLLILIGGSLFIFQPFTSAIIFVVFGLSGVLVSRKIGEISRNLGNEQAKITIGSNQSLLEVLSLIRELHLSQMTEKVIAKFFGLRTELARIKAVTAFLPNINKFVFEIIVLLCGVLIAAAQYFRGTPEKTLVALSIFLAAASRAIPSLLRVQSGFLAAKQNLGASYPTINLLSSLKKLNFQELENAPSNRDFIPTIELHDLTFTYPDQTQPILKSISLKISKGEMVAIVGSTGAGKSTLADLLLGILEPQSGYAKISHVPAPLAPKFWPGKIAYVPQDVVIIDGSVLENITLGHFSNSAKDLEKIWAILADVQLKNDIDKLESGIETLVGEHGAHLSGGQKQRLGIARALFSEPEILVLDEATSALDSVTESVLSENLFSRKGSLTLVVIAHRLSTIRHADRIIFLSDSRISAEGNFEELRASNLEFRNQAEISGL